MKRNEVKKLEREGRRRENVKKVRTDVERSSMSRRRRSRKGSGGWMD